MMTDCLDRAGSLSAREPMALPFKGTIETQRLILGRPEIDDAVALAAALSDFQVARMMANLPQPFLPGDALDWILSWRTGEQKGEAWIIRLKHDAGGIAAGSAAGAVTLTETAGGPVLAYWLTRPLWGQGLTGEAVSAVLCRHFNQSPDVPVRSGIMVDNAASLRLQERLGFSITGVRDIWSVPRGKMVNLIETELVAAAFVAN